MCQSLRLIVHEYFATGRNLRLVLVGTCAKCTLKFLDFFLHFFGFLPDFLDFETHTARG